MAVDTKELENQLESLRAQLRQASGTKSRLERQMDSLDLNDAYYDRKILDLQRRYDEQYEIMGGLEPEIEDTQAQIKEITQQRISGDNIYRLLVAFNDVYGAASESERKEFMRAFIERIDIFPDKRSDGSWIKKITFNFPIPVNGEDVTELPSENFSALETVVLMSRVKS